MSSFATKLIVLGVVVVGLIALVKFGSSTKEAIDEAQNPEKTFSEQVAEDDKRLRALPDDVKKEEEKPVEKVEEPVKEEVAAKVEPETTKAEPVVKEVKKEVEEVKVVRQFKELDEIDQIAAERLFETAITDRKIGRMPATGYKLMVDCCRELISKFPGSEFEYKAKRLLADIPERFRERYHITEEELDYDSVGVVSK